MLHPLFSLLIQRPELALDHAAGYAALVRNEAADASARYLRRLLAWVLAILGLAVFLGLAGVALMLGALHNQFQWVLVLVPGAVLLLALTALTAARRPLPGEAFAEVRAQLGADLQALHTVTDRPRHDR